VELLQGHNTPTRTTATPATISARLTNLSLSAVDVVSHAVISTERHIPDQIVQKFRFQRGSGEKASI
jgi:hypothetical protein